MKKVIDGKLVKQQLADEALQWQISDDETTIHTTYSTGGWKSSMMIANAIGFLAEAGWHHPEITIRYGTVSVGLSTHSEGGITGKDLVLAKQIDALVKWQGDGEVLQAPPAKYALIKSD